MVRELASSIEEDEKRTGGSEQNQGDMVSICVCFLSNFSCFTNALLFLYFTQKKYVGQNHVISGTMSATPHPMSFGNSRVSLSQQLSLVLVVDTYEG